MSRDGVTLAHTYLLFALLPKLLLNSPFSAENIRYKI